MKIRLNLQTSIVIVLVAVAGFIFLLNRDVPETARVNIPAQMADKIEVGPEDLQVSFSCEAGKSVLAVFHLTTTRELDIALSDGRIINLQYVANDENPHYASADGVIRFWSTGDVTFLTEDGQQTYSNCTLVNGPMGV